MLRSKVKIILGFFLFGFVLICFAQEQFVYDPKGKRDPFIPLVTSEGRLLKLDAEQPVQGALSLKGIIYDKSGASFAIINDKVVKLGDMVDDNQVLKIEKNKVLLIKEDRVFELLIKEEEK